MINTQSLPVSLTLVDKKYETHDTVSFIFTTKEQNQFQFKAGQFALVQVNIEGQCYQRAYSISSLPDENRLQLTIKRVANGIVSNWMIDHLMLFDSVDILAIEGAFNIIDCQHKKKILFISAGCGITPVMPMAEFLLQQRKQEVEQIRFIHCAKDENNLIFAKHIATLADHYSQFSYDILLEHTKTTLPVLSGLLDQEKLLKLCPDIHDYTIFLCGPIGFMEMVKTILLDISFDMQLFFQESFTPQNSQSSEDTVAQSETVTLTVPKFAINKPIIKGSLLLQALEDEKLPIIGACRSGVCGSCRCKVLQGKSESSSFATLSEQQIEEGYRLACSTRIYSDITVEI